MTICAVIQENSPANHTHSCVGEPGHAGPHFCLLGHCWPNETETTEETP